MEEFEVKFLNIDPEEIEQKILKLGGKQIFDRLIRSQTFDYPGFPLNEKGAWIRLRDDGSGKIFMAYKQRLGVKKDTGKSNDDGMEEYEMLVDGFETAKQFLLKLGLIQKFVEEKRRVQFKIENIEYDIDYYPELKPFVEIESDSWENVDKGIKLLGLDPKDKKIYSAFQIYKENGIDMLEYKEFSFNGLVKR